MAVRKRKQTNAMLYTLVVFIGLFIVASTIAVVFYIKAEDNRTTIEDMQNEFDEVATQSEIQSIPTLVGAKEPGQSRLSTMVSYVDQTTSYILGGLSATTSSEVKVDNATTRYQDALRQVQQYIDIGEPNLAGFVPMVNALVAEIENLQNINDSLRMQLDEKDMEIEGISLTNIERDEEILAEKELLQQQYDQAKQDYEDLTVSLRESTGRQVQNLMSQLEQLQADYRALNETQLRTEAQLEIAQQTIEQAKEQLATVMPGPNRDAMAYKIDGKVILVDNNAKIIHLDLGTKDHVYRGLRFTVYDRGTSVSEDGVGKAEIEVVDIAENYSSAKVINTEQSRPILPGDIVANLIWDKDRPNVFVIAGIFDLNGDGFTDTDAIEKITARIELWGGKVESAVSINTDFVILGDMPTVDSERPTLAEQELDPDALDRYEASIQELNIYNDIMKQAQSLWIPIFNYDKFLYFIGYQSELSQVAAF